jgi:uncharacterized phiE125 gp8 family phage protein
MILKRITDATSEPVSLVEIKQHLRLSTSTGAEDDTLNAYIKTAREQAENKTKRAFLTQTWRIVMDDFPSNDDYIELPRPPLSTTAGSVTITYTKDDTAYSSTTMASSAIAIDRDSEPCRISLYATNEWPDDVSTAINSVKIDFICGSSSASLVPESIKSWIKLRVGAMYENRESLVMSQFLNKQEMGRTFVDGLLDPYTITEVY